MVRNRLLKKAIIPFEEYERLVKDGVQKDILEQRIKKAIEYSNYFEKSVKEELDLNQDYSFIIASYIGVFHDTLEEILKGEDK